MYAHPSYLQSINDVANQRIAVVPLDAGAIVRQSDVAPANGLEDGWRALSIGVNPVAVLVDRVQVGSRVDVIVSYETSFLDSEGKEVATRRTSTLLSDVEVLGIAGAPQPRETLQRPPSEADAAQAADSDSAFGPASTTIGSSPVDNYGLRDSVVIATLKVSPEDAQQLAYMDTYASDIRLALRRNDDRAIEPLKPLSEEDFK
jgi:Flp pilus assembly protein CpaB